MMSTNNRDVLASVRRLSRWCARCTRPATNASDLPRAGIRLSLACRGGLLLVFIDGISQSQCSARANCSVSSGLKNLRRGYRLDSTQDRKARLLHKDPWIKDVRVYLFLRTDCKFSTTFVTRSFVGMPYGFCRSCAVRRDAIAAPSMLIDALIHRG